MSEDRPTKAEIVAVRGSPGELDLIRLDLIINYVTGPVRYNDVRPINYRRKVYTAVGPRPGDIAEVAWRGNDPVFVADFEPEYETCPGAAAATASGPPEFVLPQASLAAGGGSVGGSVGGPVAGDGGAAGGTSS